MLKKRTALILAMMLVCAMLLPACGGGGTTSSTATSTATSTASSTATSQAAPSESPSGLSGVNEFPIVQDKVELTFFCAPSALIESMDNNEFTKWYEEKTNVHIVWDAVPEQARLERLNLILAADDLPDVIFGASVKKDDEMVYGPQGKFVDLTPYIDQHGYYIKEMFDAVPYVKAGITAADGKIYSLPQVNECFHCIYDNSRIWINHRIRDELGLQNPTTTEEMKTYLMALKDAGMIPLVGAPETTTNVMNRIVGYFGNSFTFLWDRDDALHIADGQVKAAYTQPEFKEALKYMNELYSLGLIDPTTFTNTGDELKQMVEDPNGNRVGVASAYYFGSIGSLEGERHKEYDILYPVAGPEGVQYTGYNPYRHSTGQYIVTNKCENVDVAVKWADFLFSDEAAVRYIECGREDIEWRKAEANELDFYDQPANRARIEDVAYSETTNVHYYQMGPSFRSFNYRESWYRGAGTMYDKDGYEYRLHVYTMGAVKYRPNMTSMRTYPPVYTTEADAMELKRITSNIKDHRTQYVDAFITGQRNIDAEWDAYVAGFDQVEMPLYLEIKQRAYDASDYKNSIPEPGNPNAPVTFDAPINN